ncbi:ATP-dependent DNA helicase PcrA [Methanosarcinales archaeon]|nr:ATP-dependent helicase [Candidatus Methanoperedens sp.]CAG1000605.1 ATP-dependent DNA helicase PcrA [Methanosarcinales archaeon]
MINLSTAQSNIVHAPIGIPLQVLASAGSGKTRVLTERVRYIIENTHKEGVIALTFTNKAAEEMSVRLNDIEGIEERSWIATIHAVAQRILDQYGHTIGLPSELHIYERDRDRMTVFLQSLREIDVDIDSFLNVSDDYTRKNRERIIQNYMDQFSIVKRELLNEEEVKEKYASVENFWQIFQAYQQALLESGGMDFDDILVYAQKILLEQPWCGQIYRSKYKHICVDEAQDLNRAQYEFIKALCGDTIKSVLMVGDPNQMIYGFNGSSHEYLCHQFVKDYDPAKFELKENYRSSKAVIRLANKIKPGSQIESNFAFDGRSHIEAQQDEIAEALWICNKINELLKEKTKEIEGDISLNNMVVIARNRFVFQILEKFLREMNIPYSLKKGESQMEPSSTFGRVFDLAIRLRLNPKDWIDGKKLCALLKIDIPSSWGGEKLLEKFANDALNSEISFPRIQADLLKAIQNLNLEQPNIPKLCSDFKTSFEILGSDSHDVNGELERSLQELQDLRMCWTTFKRKGLGESLSSFRNAMALGQLTEDYNPFGLILSTVHTMKGLEKDIVFLMGMCEGVFPDYRARSKQEIEEERNNAFVAVTRSRRWIYITFPKKRKMPWGDTKAQSSSRFILEMQS